MSAVMLRSTRFRKWTAYVGVLTNVLLLAIYVPAIGFLLWAVGGLALPIWLSLVGWELVWLGRLGRSVLPRASDSGAT